MFSPSDDVSSGNHTGEDVLLQSDKWLLVKWLSINAERGELCGCLAWSLLTLFLNVSKRLFT